MKELATVGEAARTLGVTVTYLYNLLRAGRMGTATKVDGKWRIPWREINVRQRKRRSSG